MSLVVAAAAVSGFGVGWRGLGRVLLNGGRIPGEVPAVVASQDISDPRSAKLMSRSARLAAIAARQVLAESAWSSSRDEVGYYLGVGASAGDMAEILPILRVAIRDGEFSTKRLGSEGLAVCPPLLSFQLLNNFTMCHGAILEGIGGPNAALFSRGGGTVAALSEALYALGEGACDRALAGGADCPVDPVTASELQRDLKGVAVGEPAEGAGLLALATTASEPLARITHCELVGCGGRSPAEALSLALPDGSSVRHLDAVLLACSRIEVRNQLTAAVGQRFGPVRVLDATTCLGEGLAAGPALAWVAALDLLVSEKMRDVLVVNVGADGDLGVVWICGPGAHA